ncbi:hypothetical protein QTP86_025585 [Hemibagrus guttatus]|nr:hypothetical protein QTP86_025585 [Hemibagrus guttatus]
MSKAMQKKSHWSERVSECAVRRDARGDVKVPLQGGAENGEFVYVGRLDPGSISYDHGTLTEGELVLEVDTLPVSGLPLYDVLSAVKNSNGAVRLKTVRQGFSKDNKTKKAKETLPPLVGLTGLSGHASFSGTDRFSGHASFTGTDRLSGHASFSETDRLSGHASFTGTDRLSGHASFTGTDRLSGHASFTGTDRLSGHASFTGTDR